MYISIAGVHSTLAVFVPASILFDDTRARANFDSMEIQT